MKYQLLKIISSTCAFSVFISPTQHMGSRAFNSSVTPPPSCGAAWHPYAPLRLSKSRWRNKSPPPAFFLPLCGGQVIEPCPADAPASSARAGYCPIHGGGQRPRSGRSQPPSFPGKTARKYAGLEWRAAASAPHTLPLAVASVPGFPPE